MSGSDASGSLPSDSSQPPQKKTRTCSDPDPDIELAPCCESSAEEDSSDDDHPEEYYKQATESDGFDVDVLPKHFPQRIPFRYILPLKNLRKDLPTFNKVTELAELAIEHYNGTNNANFKFLKVLKANSMVCGGVVFYITLEAEDPSDSQAKIFQARVFWAITRDEVMLCRLKDTN